MCWKGLTAPQRTWASGGSHRVEGSRADGLKPRRRWPFQPRRRPKEASAAIGLPERPSWQKRTTGFPQRRPAEQPGERVASPCQTGKLFGIFLRDDARVAVGGAFVRTLFVPIHLRNQGHGTKLMQAVEAEAKACGCRQILLETYDFQAPQFYLKLGFEVRARVPDHIQGHDMFVMAKHLVSL
jgi:Acetyltransferase (GNAT) domain